MANRTELVCICEGEVGPSIDPIFINRLMRKLKPTWVRKSGSNFVRLIPCKGRSQLIQEFPNQLKICLRSGGESTLMVWADVDDDKNPDALREQFWEEAKKKEITQEQFDKVIFVLAKNRLENWVEFLLTGNTDEMIEGPRLNNNRDVRKSADILANHCIGNSAFPMIPPSLQWSCKNWKALLSRIKSS